MNPTDGLIVSKGEWGVRKKDRPSRTKGVVFFVVYTLKVPKKHVPDHYVMTGYSGPRLVDPLLPVLERRTIFLYVPLCRRKTLLKTDRCVLWTWDRQLNTGTSCTVELLLYLSQTETYLRPDRDGDPRLLLFRCNKVGGR